MKKTIYILCVLLIFAVVGCVNDLDMTPIGEETVDVTVPEEDGDGVYGNAPMVDFGDALTRSTLTFDYNTRTLLFSWVMGDLVGVFPVQDDNSKSQIVYTVNEMISAHRARFTQVDQDAQPDNINKGEQFVSYKPAKENYEGKSSEIPFSFANQYQENPVNMKSYWDSLKVSSIGEGKYYKESEKMASKHLPKYDFQVSAGAAPRDNHLVFDYTRLSSFVRLYLKVTEQATYDSIIILNKDADFFIDGTMDISKNVSSAAFTPKTKLHYVTLRLGEKTVKNGVTEYAGFKIWNDNKAPKIEDQCALWSAEKKAGYIVAYMAFVPIQLKNLANGCTLYLLGHDKSGNKKYYRAKQPLSKYNLEQNKIQQWAPSEHSVDEPIEVVPVEVEEWKADMEFSNEGTGTEEW